MKPDLLRESPLRDLHPPQSSSDFQALVCMPLTPQHPAATWGSGDILQYIPVKWQVVVTGEHVSYVLLPRRFRRSSQRRKRSWASFTLHSLFSPSIDPGWSGKFTKGTECIAAIGLGGLKCPGHFCKWALALLRSHPLCHICMQPGAIVHLGLSARTYGLIQRCFNRQAFFKWLL